MFPTANGMLILTQNNGFYTCLDGNCSEWDISANSLLRTTTIYSGIQLKDGGFALGTISDGLVFLSENGDIRYHILKKDGLNNNTVLSLFEDEEMNVWAGLDNGISCINLQSPFRIFNDYQGNIGTVYASAIHNGNLYLGTNQGLYHKKLGSNQPLRYIENTSGQIWCLTEIEGELFCGHHTGTYLVEGSQVRSISDIPGAWKLYRLPGHPDLILQGNYSGLYIISKSNGLWQIRNKIEGFENSARHFEIDDDHNIWVNHEYEGIYRIITDASFSNAEEVNLVSDIPNGKNSGLAKFRGQILYSYREGVYSLNKENKQFVKDSILTQIILNDEYVSGKLVVDSRDNLWAFTKNNIYCISSGQLSDIPDVISIPLSSHMRKTISGYDNITHMFGNIFLLGTVDGYILINISGFPVRNYSIYLNSVFLKSLEQNMVYLNTKVPGSFSYRENSPGFDFSVPEYDKYSALEYQYRLHGVSTNWSEWTAEHSVLFENLKYGDYLFQARARVGNRLTENTISYVFRINKPWYITNAVIAGYIILGLTIIVIINIIYQRNYKKKKNREMELSKKQYELNHLEAQQQIFMMRNEQLRKDVESKNRELFISTMNIVDKNELLGSIKQGLEKLPGSQNIKPIVQLIDKNLNSKKDWQVFEEAINNADKDFIVKVKSKHPELTHNDLRLCVYLRLNLSTKEIAPLLNISVKSAEIKRYRLRKKMDLPHGKGLVEYILEI